jgi:hypothetical protein
MGHYFNSSDARDLCYRANIGRDTCRGLGGSDKAPAPLAPPRRAAAPLAPAPPAPLAPAPSAPEAPSAPSAPTR